MSYLCYVLLFTGRGTTCECSGATCPDGAENGTCVTQPGGYCFVAVEMVIDERGEEVLERTAGCLPPDESGFMQVSYPTEALNFFK